MEALAYIPNVLGLIFAYYGLNKYDRDRVRAILGEGGGNEMVLEIYDMFTLMYDALRFPFHDDPQTITKINSLNKIEGRIAFHPDLDPRHYPNVAVLHDKGYDRSIVLPNLISASMYSGPHIKEMKMLHLHIIDGKYCDQIPPCVKHFECDIIVIMNLINKCEPRTRNIDSNIIYARAADVLGPNVRHLTVRGQIALNRVHWDGVETYVWSKSGPITPDTILYCLRDIALNEAIISDSVVVPLRETLINSLGLKDCAYDERDILDYCISLRGGIKCSTHRLKKDGTFLPRIVLLSSGHVSVDYSHVESTSITHIEVVAMSIPKLSVNLPRDCTSLVLLKLNALQVNILFHSSAIKCPHSGGMFPRLRAVDMRHQDLKVIDKERPILDIVGF